MSILVSFAGPIWADLPVVDDLRVKLNLDDLTTLEKATSEFRGNLGAGGARETHVMVNVGSNYEALSPTGSTVVNSNNVAWL